MAKEREVGGLGLHKKPVAGRHNKFVIIEDGARFLPFEDNARVPTLREMLAALACPTLEQKDAQDASKWHNPCGIAMYAKVPDQCVIGGEELTVSKTPQARLVYGEVQDGLVFIEEEEARSLARLHKVLQTAKTWGEFKAQEPSWYEDAVRRLEEHDQDGTYEEPAAEQGFDAEEIPGYAEGDWPGFPHVSMESWVPDEVQDRFGSMTHSWGPDATYWIVLAPDKEDQIVSAMRRHGYDCVRNGDLVWEASGYG